jgi:hypothetical protein
MSDKTTLRNRLMDRRMKRRRLSAGHEPVAQRRWIDAERARHTRWAQEVRRHRNTGFWALWHSGRKERLANV